MINILNKDILKRAVFPIFAVVVFGFTPLYKSMAKEYINSSLKGATVTYALLRGINAGVSMVQKSSVSLGIGVEGNIAIGEIFDPLNDAVERFSDMVTLSIWALGSEKVLYEISKTFAFVVLVFLLALALLFYDSTALKNFLAILIAIRLFIPFSAVISNYFDKEIFAPKIEQSLKVLNFSQNTSLENTKKEESISNSYKEFKNKMKFYINNSSKIIAELINYSLLFFGKYFLNLILLPLSLFYILKILLAPKIKGFKNKKRH